ncbi:protein of unknown function [Shewanella benthica]|uniref:Uncharacterized protein n=1 Tax=Shewanella benthica TaxID=43661 RepID=A0A330M8P8_9GAMM|nr:protein of unknown function [Shewanella benthica]
MTCVGSVAQSVMRYTANCQLHINTYILVFCFAGAHRFQYDCH